MTQPWSPFQLYHTAGRAPVVLVCEHAAAEVPPDFAELSLPPDQAQSHAVWDIGALNLARGMSQALDAPLVAGGVSRALYDCNRPVEAPDAIPTQSERICFPGNADLTPAQRDLRHRLIHDLFHAATAQVIAAQRAKLDTPVAVVTVHSFTPVYHGEKRALEIGFIHHGDPTLSIAACQIEQSKSRYRAALNAPYSRADGVTYSLEKHGDALGLHTTMIEVRNDLIADPTQAQDMAIHLADTLRGALASLAKDAAKDRPA